MGSWTGSIPSALHTLEQPSRRSLNLTHPSIHSTDICHHLLWAWHCSRHSAFCSEPAEEACQPGATIVTLSISIYTRILRHKEVSHLLGSHIQWVAQTGWEPRQAGHTASAQRQTDRCLHTQNPHLLPLRFTHAEKPRRPPWASTQQHPGRSTGWELLCCPHRLHLFPGSLQQATNPSERWGWGRFTP